MLLSCGDALVDFLPVKSVDGRDAAVPVAGGSCLNIAVGMARLGAPAGFVGGISTDLFGRIISSHALASKVDLRYATQSEHQTTLAFVRHVAGEPQYAFYDEATASRNWTYRRGSIPFEEIEAIHVGSTTLANDEGATQALAMIRDAGGSVTISFDPNCRPNLVKHKARYVDWMDAFAAAAHIVRMSDVDFEFLYGGGDYAGKAKSLIRAGASLVVITRGIKGAQAWHAEAGAVELHAPTVDVVDTIGAGDSFQAALLFTQDRTDRHESPDADEFGRTWSRGVICVSMRCFHMRARRCRSAATIRCGRGIVPSSGTRTDIESLAGHRAEFIFAVLNIETSDGAPVRILVRRIASWSGSAGVPDKAGLRKQKLGPALKDEWRMTRRSCSWSDRPR
jgi:fructokinase